jgi:small neutral amino acid transporter SnatA (MarC family)
MNSVCLNTGASLLKALDSAGSAVVIGMSSQTPQEGLSRAGRKRNRAQAQSSQQQMLVPMMMPNMFGYTPLLLHCFVRSHHETPYRAHVVVVVCCCLI